MRFRLLPTDDKFFSLFDDAAANASECARHLREVIAGTDGSGHERINACEHKGDEITRTILTRLNSTFVTPFDREDIHALAESPSTTSSTTSRRSSELILLTKVDHLAAEMLQQADLLVRMAEEAQSLIGRLESMKGVEPHLDAIDQLESEGDAVYRTILARLYGGELDALEVLRVKGIVEALEGALNTIEDISDVVESIVLKHA